MRWINRKPATVLCAALLAGAFTAAGAPAAVAKHHPTRTTAAIDWQMPSLTVDADNNGVIDSYIDGNRTANVPLDGRYDVALDGCRSANATTYMWTVDEQRITTNECRTIVRLKEGTYWVKLKTRGPGGTAVAHKRVRVRTEIVLALGDSYAAGSGAQVFSDNPTMGGYFDANCGRTPRSHQALAALAMEKADPRSSVILIHLSCGGAQINPGLLTPFRGNRPQVDQARDLLNGQRIDTLLLSIGGNDAGFGTMVGLCLATPGVDCPLVPYGGYPTFHEYLMSLFDQLRNGSASEPIDGLPLLAECLGGSGCTTSETPDGSGAPLRVKPRNVVYTAYPDLTRADDGSYCDVVPGASDPGLLNATAEEYAWLDNVVEAVDQAPVYTYTASWGAPYDLAQTSPGLNAIIAETHKRYGWTAVPKVYSRSFTRSTGHGYCADSFDPTTGSGRWTFRFTDGSLVFPPNLLVPVHPNAGGHEHYATQILRAIRN